MKKSLWVLSASILLLLFIAGSSFSFAKGGTPQGKGHGHGRAGQKGKAGKAAKFSDRDQQLIRRYFTTQTANLPPGLAKRGGDLPPGLEKQLERNGTLPPGLQKRIQPFPAELESQLPPLPVGCGCTRVMIGFKALILDRAKTILDVMVIR